VRGGSVKTLIQGGYPAGNDFDLWPGQCVVLLITEIQKTGSPAGIELLQVLYAPSFPRG